ncbi:MAG: ROK family protein [Patescibacteria group bacterium]
MTHGVQVVFDIGGTNTRVAIVSEDTLGEVHTFKTSNTPEEGLGVLSREIKKMVGAKNVSALCGDIAGIVKDGVIFVSPNLPKWNRTNIAEELRRAFGGIPTTLFNDAELVALGEYFYGAGKNEKNMLYITVSTGVGGVHIVHGKVNRGTYNAELGHQIIKDDMELESLVSGTAVAKKYGVHPKDLDSKDALCGLADLLAIGLYNTTLHFTPEVIVLGGSMILGKNAIPVDRVQVRLEEMVKKYYPTSPRIKLAQLGDQGGLYGGLAYLVHHSFDKER